jgi:UDP-galactopyranose mutase
MPYDIVCFSHLRWSFVYQRPQHLLSRFGRFQRVFFIEEPLFDSSWPRNEINQDKESGVYVVTPHLQKMQSEMQIVNGQKFLLDNLFYSKYINDYIFWYYSPMALPYSNHFFQRLTIYDCMDELSAFKFASPELKENEDKLLKLADLVFTGGHHLYEAKKK